MQGYSEGQSGTVGTAGPGTIVVKNTSGNLYRVVVAGTYVGSVTFHDAATAAGTTATSGIITLGLPLLNTFRNIEVGVRFRTGLVYEATGTIGGAMVYVWD